MVQSCLQVVPTPVGAPRRHIQVLHLALTLDHQTHERPCAFQVTINQVVDNHARCRVDNQQDQQDHHPTVESIAHHHQVEDQGQTLQGHVD